jgi:tRNA dimethylallyltransferase
LLRQGYHLGLPAMSGLGYRQVGQYLAGELSLDEAVQHIKKETRRYVRQQYTWFRRDDPRIHWFDVSGEFYEEVRELVKEFLGAEI